MLLAALLAISAPDFIVSLVSSASGRCIYQTGDVLLNVEDFRGNLNGIAKGHQGLVIYHAPDTSRRCLARARRIAVDVGFREIRVEVAPANLDMGPAS
jgi:hypothetical protein